MLFQCGGASFLRGLEPVLHGHGDTALFAAWGMKFGTRFPTAAPFHCGDTLENGVLS